MTRRIRDTVHGYMYLTTLEAAITLDPLLLRLHYVHQTSFTYLTYPNAHSMRFPHSMGVMHVASEMFRHALISSSPSEIQNLSDETQLAFTNISISLDDVIKELYEKNGHHISSEKLYSSILQPISPRTGAATSDRYTDLPVSILVLYQAVRMAAFLHDVGHPPFSHIVEYGLEESVEEYKGHEFTGRKISYEIMKVFYAETYKDNNEKLRKAPLIYQNAPQFCEACCKLAEHLLAEDKDDRLPLSRLKSTLLSGDVDADRLDYVRRDAITAGLVPTFDMQRMMDAMSFCKSDRTKKIEIRMDTSCLSSLENFFQARYELYRWMIYHHDVVRRNLVMQRLVSLITTSDSEISPIILKKGKEFAQFALGNPSIDVYSRFTDSYFLEMLWEIKSSLKDTVPKIEERTPDEKTLSFYLDIILGRRNDRLKTLLKGIDTYTDFIERIELPKDETVVSLNTNEKFHHFLGAKFYDFVAAIKKDKSFAKFVFSKKIEDMANRIFGHDSDPIMVYYIGSFEAGPGKDFSLWKRGADNVQVEYSKISPPLAMLNKAWQSSQQILVYSRADNEQEILHRETAAESQLEAVREALEIVLRSPVTELLREQ